MGGESIAWEYSLQGGPGGAIHLDLKLRSSGLQGGLTDFRPFAGLLTRSPRSTRNLWIFKFELGRDPSSRRRNHGSISRADSRDERSPGVLQVARALTVATPPILSICIGDARRHARDLRARATERIAGPDRPPLLKLIQGPEPSGASATARSVLISDTESAPPAAAAAAQAATSAVLGAKFHDKRLSGERANVAQQRLEVAGIRRRYQAWVATF